MVFNIIKTLLFFFSAKQHVCISLSRSSRRIEFYCTKKKEEGEKKRNRYHHQEFFFFLLCITRLPYICIQRSLRVCVLCFLNARLKDTKKKKKKKSVFVFHSIPMGTDNRRLGVVAPFIWAVIRNS